MKLKLEVSGAVSILAVRVDPGEMLSLQQVAVFKAGLAKLIASGKKQIVLDLTQGVTIAPEARGPLLALMEAPIDPKTPAEIAIAGPMGIVADPAAGVEALTAGVFGLLLQEFKLRTRRDRLKDLKEKASAKLAALESDPAIQQARDLRRRNGVNRREIRTLETILRQWKALGILPTQDARARRSPSDEQTQLRSSITRALSETFVQKKFFDSLDTSAAPTEGGP